MRGSFVCRVHGDVAMLVGHQEDAHVPRRRGAVEEHELAQRGVNVPNAGRLQVVDDGPGARVELTGLHIAGSPALALIDGNDPIAALERVLLVHRSSLDQAEPRD